MDETDLSDELIELQYLAGHYAAAVADEIMKDGLVIALLRADAFAGENEPECEAALLPPDDYPSRSGIPGAHDISLDWDAASGWSIYVDVQTPERSYTQITRWMGAGLVPAPARVAGFMAAGMVDIHGTGAEDKPYYRNRGDELGVVMDRLRPFALDHEGSHYRMSPEHRFSLLRAHRSLQHTVEDMTAAESVGLLPIREGELRALCRLLDWHEPEISDLRRLVIALADDLKGRFHAGTKLPPDDLAGRVALHSEGIKQAKQIDSR